MLTVTQQQHQQFGNYRLLRLLDSGGFADVYLAEHIYLKTLSAVKVLQMQLFDEEQQQRFLEEAQTIARLKHPRVIQVVDFGVENAVPFLVMTYAPNGNMRQRYPTGSRLPLNLVVHYIKQAAEALHYAHNQRLIHRDMKPENLLLDANNNLLLSDFGIAIVARSSHSQSLQDIVGTAIYMAPEQIRGYPRPASDQYALAVLAYEWICGVPPFEGNTYIETAKLHLIAPVPHPTMKEPMLPGSVEAVLLRALAKDYHQRFESVQDFANALERAYRLNIMPQPAPRISREEQEERETARPQTERVRENGRVSRRLIVTTLGSLGVLSAAGGFLGWKLLSNQPQEQYPAVWQQTPVPVTDNTLGQTKLIYERLENTNINEFAIDTLAWSHDGTHILSAGSTEFSSNIAHVGLMTTWNPSNGVTFLANNTYTGPEYHRGQGAAWSPDGKRIAATTSYTIDHASFVTENTFFTGVHVLDALTNKRLQFWPVSCYALAWSPDGQTLALAGTDKTLQLMLVNASSGEILLSYYVDSLYVPGAILAWSPDSRYIASYGKEIRIWEAATAQSISQYKSKGSPASDLALAWSPDGKHLASSWGSEVHISTTLTGKQVLAYKGHVKNVRAIAWSPDGSKLATGGEEATVQIWNAKDGKLLYTYRQHTASILALTWSPDGKSIASGSGDGVIRVWTVK